jgi:hypothetical protein
MATWVEDIVQALKNLGGQAHRKDIFDEVVRIRTEPIPLRGIESMQERIIAHKSDSAHFKGKDLFKKIGNGFWALREGVESGSSNTKSTTSFQSTRLHTYDQKKADLSNSWLEDIIQALMNLGGQASLSQIDEEITRIRQEPLPKNWQYVIRVNIYQHSSDSGMFTGKELFRRVRKGEWALSDQATPTSVPKKALESFEDIENTLRTIKEYRDYSDPNLPSWKDYVNEIFNILGFSTTTISPRITILNMIGANHKPKAIVAFVQPGENFEELVPGLLWESFLSFATNFYQVDWGILTDGLQLKVVEYLDHVSKSIQYWPDFDGLINKARVDSFLSIYNVLKKISGSNVSRGEKHPNESNGTSLIVKARKSVIIREFLKDLLEKANSKTPLHKNASLGIHNNFSINAGKKGLSYGYIVLLDHGIVNVYIDNGEKEWNKSEFTRLFEHKTEIEEIFGESLEWHLLPEQKSSYIRFTVSGYNLRNREVWVEFQDKLIDAMIRLERAFRPFIQNFSG